MPMQNEETLEYAVHQLRARGWTAHAGNDLGPTDIVVVLEDHVLTFTLFDDGCIAPFMVSSMDAIDTYIEDGEPFNAAVEAYGTGGVIGIHGACTAWKVATALEKVS